MEMFLILIIVVVIFTVNKKISAKKFFYDNQQYFMVLKEDNYDFLVRSKYGEDIDPNQLFMLRIRNALIVMAAILIIFSTQLSFLYIMIALLVGFAVFKLSYMQLRTYYKNHLHQIDMLLPYYLKSIEILIQHYTVPVAIGKSVDTSPEIFKPGLKELIDKINAGDMSVNPYMDFAKQYPVRDSMRMMRLLYRLGLGSQERKHEQLLTFSKTISNLQNKARETKYKARLEKMEKRTMYMLVMTGGGTMIIILLSMLLLFQF